MLQNATIHKVITYFKPIHYFHFHIWILREKTYQNELPLARQKIRVPQCYQCMHCNFKLPKKNFNLAQHSCFANLNDSEAVYVVETDRLCRATNIEQVQNNVDGHGTEDHEQSSSVSDKKKAVTRKTNSGLTMMNCYCDSNISRDTSDLVSTIGLDATSNVDSEMVAEEMNDGTSGIFTSVSDDNNFTEHTKNYVLEQSRQSANTEFKNDFLHILSETNKRSDGIDGLHIGEILRKLLYKNRRLLQHKIMNDLLEAEQEAGLL
ncbi:uncharacterized protein LOC113562411 [Ooceraea biroi]|uniref:uncharacterized protein LOC113562411 n=1 Tax=Ooceraea biroi TaxID=2015173 RepID=UPI000F081331|nr:uncharacterized protein LOC113562411 [Ooceraea biroi]